MKLVIDRSKWRHGGDQDDDIHGPTKMLNKKGKMCCLGFYALAKGYTEEEIKERAYPVSVIIQNDMKNLFPELTSYHIKDHPDESTAAKNLIKVNDDDIYTKEERENAIKEGFAEIDVEVEFVGEYPE